MLDVSWVDEQIARVRAGTATMQNARDFALLCIARDHLQEPAPRAAVQPETVTVTPTIQQVEEALSKISVSTREDRRKVQELREAARIMQDE